MADFLEATRNRPPARLLSDWLPQLDLHGGPALDLGCGTGAEAEYLAKNGFMVDAIDKSATAAKYARERCAGLTVDVVQADFREVPFPPDHYAIAVSINALPFVGKEECRVLITALQSSLKVGGAALLGVFGPEHAWADRTDMSFWTLDEFASLWDGWNVLTRDEYKGPFPLVSGENIFQHRISIVARKTA